MSDEVLVFHQFISFKHSIKIIKELKKKVHKHLNWRYELEDLGQLAINLDRHNRLFNRNLVTYPKLFALGKVHKPYTLPPYNKQFVPNDRSILTSRFEEVLLPIMYDSYNSDEMMYILKIYRDKI